MNCVIWDIAAAKSGISGKASIIGDCSLADEFEWDISYSVYLLALSDVGRMTVNRLILCATPGE